MTKKQILLTLSPTLFIIILPALLVWLGGPKIEWPLPEQLLWLPVIAGFTLSLSGLNWMVQTVALLWLRGEGTLTPLDPTRKLVVLGPYRSVRNPMYIGLVTILLGEAIWFGSLAVLALAVLVALAAVLYVTLKEERDLEQRFGEDYRVYKANVPAWIPRRKPWQPAESMVTR